ncbi:MAG: hypothetical protein FWF20_06985 [Betaproteobacteria bacterium]|nr:hypothetical protein [Betaproteobacteria bacterium]MCL2886513.1 hypothetical protein [Betaproteobacteria bacterium]
MSNTIETLRDHLFSTLEDLRAKDNPMEIERAKTVCEVAQTIINSAKVEVDAMRFSGVSTNSNFLALAVKPFSHKPALIKTGAGVKEVEQHDGYTVTTHRPT